jgi:hypothetical protein
VGVKGFGRADDAYMSLFSVPLLEGIPSPVIQRVLAVLLTLVVVFGFAVPASADAVSDEERFVELINDLRASQGLGGLEMDTELTQLARSWTTSLSNTGQLSHSPDLAVGLTQSWSKLGENVGVSPEGEITRLFEAFINSPSHYSNLVDPAYDSIGVGVVYRDGRLWTTHRFMQRAPQRAAEGSTFVAPQGRTGTVTPNAAVISGILQDLARL